MSSSPHATRLAAIALWLLAAWLPEVQASVFQPVINTADSGPGSLRTAINAANGNTGGTIITFSIGAELRTAGNHADHAAARHHAGNAHPGLQPTGRIGERSGSRQ